MKKIKSTKQGHLLICGDYNLVPDQDLDSSSGRKRFSSPLNSFLTGNDLYDVWWCCHAEERDYTFLSPRHNTYIRIDLFLSDKILLQNVRSSQIHTTTWTDHAPVTIQIANTSSIPSLFVWHVNNQILQLPSNTSHLQQKLEEFFEINTGSVADPAVLWHAHKSYIRGFFIQLGSKLKKSKVQRFEELTAVIAPADLQNKTLPSPSLQSQIFKLHQDLRSLLIEGFEIKQKQLKARSYATNNKAGRTMAARIKGQLIKSKIAYLYHLQSNDKLINPQAIANAFSTYYSDLYNLNTDSQTHQPNQEAI